MSRPVIIHRVILTQTGIRASQILSKKKADANPLCAPLGEKRSRFILASLLMGLLLLFLTLSEDNSRRTP